MQFSLSRSRDAVTGPDIFRVATPLIYITLLLHGALAARLQNASPDELGLAAGALLGLLLLVSIMRLLGPGRGEPGGALVLIELGLALIAVSLLKLQTAVPMMPVPWMIGIASVFPLALRAAAAYPAVLLIACTGLLVQMHTGMALSASAPLLVANIFIGILSTLLYKSLRMNQEALRMADINDRRFNAVARGTRQLFIITDASYRVKYVNPALQEVLGYAPSEVENGNLTADVHEEDIAAHKEKLRFLRNTAGNKIFSRHRTRHRDGHWVWLETRGYNLLRDPAIEGLVFSIEDITARKEAEQKLEEEHSLLRAVLDLNPSMIYVKDAAGRFTLSNLSFQRRYGYNSDDELRGKTSLEVMQSQAVEGLVPEAPEMADMLHLQDMQVIQSGNALEDLEVQGFWESEVGRWYRTNKYPLRDARGQISGVLGITRDITDRKEYEMRLENLAMHDPLTGLPNRRYLLEKLRDEIAACVACIPGLTDASFQSDQALSTLFCDIDFFKSVNDTHGHEIGDKCLLEITRRLTLTLPSGDFLARFGGDEFVILCRSGEAGARRQADAALQALSEPIVAGDVIVKVNASIGIALLTPAHHTPSDLLRDADAAMYQAKDRGRNRYQLFDANLQSSTMRRSQMDVALRFALERSELALTYQPKVSLVDGSLKGFEMLLRWNHPQYGEIPPSEFIPIAESSGLIVPIGLWALEQACHQFALWQKQFEGMQGQTLSVNVSMRQLLQVSFLEDVAAILARTAIDPASLYLELTETSAMANPLQSIENLTRLRQLGLRLALDDFGTGYSSLAYLQKLPIDALKIDRAFVKGLGFNPGDAEIVRLILALARTLDLETIAEGVESTGQVRELMALGCYQGQGFLFSRAVPAAAAERLLRERHRFALV